MCRSMVDIQSAVAVKEEEKKKIEERNNRAKILWSALLHRATIRKKKEQRTKDRMKT